MRRFLVVLCLLSGTGLAMAQSQSDNPAAATDALGRPLQPDAKGKADTTAATTTPSNPPAASPQGETPPGNAAAPLGSSKPVKPKE